MPLKKIASPAPKYMAAADIFIGDMSDANYEFLLFDRPVILLANDWLRENFPDIGIKTDISGLEAAIESGLENPDEFQEARRHWLKKTMHRPDGRSSKRVLDVILERSGFTNPKLYFIHGNDVVRRYTVLPLYEEAARRDLLAAYIFRGPAKDKSPEIIYVAAHNEELKIRGGFKVHIDHGLKGPGVADFELQKEQYRRDDYLPGTDLHVTEGEISYEKTKILVGPYADRVVMAGYPRSDDFLRCNTPENKKSVFRELGFDPDKPLIAYVPAGKKSYYKPGGSLTDEVVGVLKDIASRRGYNILVKLKYPGGIIVLQALNKLRRILGI